MSKRYRFRGLVQATPSSGDPYCRRPLAGATGMRGCEPRHRLEWHRRLCRATVKACLRAWRRTVLWFARVSLRCGACGATHTSTAIFQKQFRTDLDSRGDVEVQPRRTRNNKTRLSTDGCERAFGWTEEWPIANTGIVLPDATISPQWQSRSQIGMPESVWAGTEARVEHGCVRAAAEGAAWQI